MAQITLNSSGVASNGTLALQSNGTTTAVTIDTAQNVGASVTPSAWKSNYKAVQVGNAAAVAGRTDFNTNYFSSNWYVNSSNQDIYQNTGFATIYSQGSGTHAWYNAASGTAGNTITFTQAMTLDASGNLGVGETSPTFRISIKGDTSVKSGMNFKNTVQNQELQIGCSASSTDCFFNTISNSPIYFGTNNTERVRITSGGDLLVGKNTAAVSSGGNGLYVAANGFVGTNIPSSLVDTFNVFNSTAAVYRFYVTQGGTIFATSTTISAISDQRLKENVQDLDVGLDAVMALKPRKFDWKEGKGKDIKGDRGWIAQEFEQVFPDMIDEWKDESPEGEDPYKSVRADLIPVLVKAIQELKAIVDAQAVEIAALKGTA